MLCCAIKPTQDFHQRITEHIKTPLPKMKEALKSFLSIVSYQQGQYDQDSSFQSLLSSISSIEDQYDHDRSTKNRVFYMALPPSVFVDVARCLKKNCYSAQGINRIIVEKPFGSDLESSREMQRELKKEFNEDEVSCPFSYPISRAYLTLQS